MKGKENHLSEELKQAVVHIPRAQKIKILQSFKEPDIHPHIKRLLEKIDQDVYVEITHGNKELGTDLVMVRHDRNFKIHTYIGIIVKMGNIKGNTRGPIDEIKSQIEQALTHKKRLKNISRPFYVSEIWIMVLGEISGTAHERLEREVQGKNIKIFDINHLINLFTDNYPQIFFEGKPLDFIEKKIIELENNHFLRKKGIGLSQYFVEPLVAQVGIIDDLDEENLSLLIEKDRIPFYMLKNILLDKPKSILLVGEPGVGKSAVVAKLAIDLLKAARKSILERKKEKIEIPIFISARKFIQYPDVENLLKDTVPVGFEGRFEINLSIIDGLDEITSHRERLEILEKAKIFSDKLNSSLLVSSRKINTVETPPEEYEKYELLPLEIRQALQLFQKLISNENLLSTLKEGLNRIESYIPLYPLSLILLIEIVENYKEVPASITELYDRFIDIALGRYDKEKGIEVLFSYYIKKRFLSELAYEKFFKNKKVEISKKVFDNFLNSYSKEHKWNRQKVHMFVNEIERAGLLDIKQTVSFKHRSFLDYFCALYIYDNREHLENLENLLKNLYFDNNWDDITFFYIGMKREVPSTLLKKILGTKKEDLIFLIKKFLIGKLLQAGWYSISDIKYNGIKQSIILAPSIRDKFLNLIRKRNHQVPQIFADGLILMLSDLSFKSGFIFQECKKCLYDSSASAVTFFDFYTLLMLFYSIEHFLTPEDLSNIAKMIYNKIQSSPKLTYQEKVLTVLLLNIIAKRDKKLAKYLIRKLKKLVNRNPEILEEIFPLKQSKSRKLMKKGILKK